MPCCFQKEPTGPTHELMEGQSRLSSVLGNCEKGTSPGRAPDYKLVLYTLSPHGMYLSGDGIVVGTELGTIRTRDKIVYFV